MQIGFRQRYSKGRSTITTACLTSIAWHVAGERLATDDAEIAVPNETSTCEFGHNEVVG